MSDDDWSAIEELRHLVWLERRESVSNDFIAETHRLISERVPDENTVRALRDLIEPIDEAVTASPSCSSDFFSFCRHSQMSSNWIHYFTTVSSEGLRHDPRVQNLYQLTRPCLTLALGLAISRSLNSMAAGWTRQRLLWCHC